MFIVCGVTIQMEDVNPSSTDEEEWGGGMTLDVFWKIYGLQI